MKKKRQRDGVRREEEEEQVEREVGSGGGSGWERVGGAPHSAALNSIQRFFFFWGKNIISKSR